MSARTDDLAMIKFGVWFAALFLLVAIALLAVLLAVNDGGGTP